MSYLKIADFGSNTRNSDTNDPVTYCTNTNLDNNFIHTSGQRNGPDSKSCQMFMSDYCANTWDDNCEYIYNNVNTKIPNMLLSCNNNYKEAQSTMSPLNGNIYTSGQILLRNTAAKKYLVPNTTCVKRFEPFDPMVADSPMISYLEPTYGGDSCVPSYAVNPNTIDDDPVMNRILSNPLVGLDILINIYNTANRMGTLNDLKNTKLYRFFMSPIFQQKVTASQLKSKVMVSQGKIIY